MIGKLKGIIDSIGDNYLLLDVNGVCYEVFVSGYSLSQVQGVGTAATLLIETHMREDHIHLYGFVSEEERSWFRLLTTVKGVGTKMALAFLSALSPSDLSVALVSQDHAALTTISGVGKKLAERVVTELKDKVGTLPTTGLGSVGLANLSTSMTGIPEVDNIITDAVSALVNLGYTRSDAFIKVSAIVSDSPEISVEELIRISLKEMAK